MRAARGRRDFRFYDADELNFLNSPASGGVVSAGANIFPSAWRQVVESSFGEDEKKKRNGGYREALLNQAECLKKLCLAYRAGPAGLIKAVLKDMGLISSAGVYKKRAMPYGGQNREEILILYRELSKGSPE
jgi:dihydrodipicolinate synthase/N-acetylneuraminate lyase